MVDVIGDVTCESQEVLGCRAVLGRSLVSFFGTRNSKRIEYLIGRLLQDDVLVVSDLLALGPTSFQTKYPVNHDDLRYVSVKLAVAGLDFNDKTSVLIRALSR